MIKWRCITFVIPGKPVPWSRTGRGQHGARFTPTNVRSWQGAVRDAALPHFPKPLAGDVPVVMTAAFWLPFPTSKARKRRPVPGRPHTGRPDLRNLIGLIEDALEGIVYVEDRQIVAYGPGTYKWTCGQLDNRPRTEVKIEWEDSDHGG